MKNKVFILLTLLLGIITFSLLVYPTLYHYDEVVLGGNHLPVKINRFTGKTFMFVPSDGGWVEYSNTKESSN